MGNVFTDKLFKPPSNNFLTGQDGILTRFFDTFLGSLADKANDLQDATNDTDSRLTDLEDELEPIMVTAEKGIAIQYINKTGAISVKGSLVELHGTTALSIKKTPVNSSNAVGVIYDAGIADGSAVWVVTIGLAQVLLEGGTGSSLGNWVRSSLSETGKVDATNAAAPTGSVANLDIHFKQCGYAMETKAAGPSQLMLMKIQFN